MPDMTFDLWANPKRREKGEKFANMSTLREDPPNVN